MRIFDGSRSQTLRQDGSHSVKLEIINPGDDFEIVEKDLTSLPNKPGITWIAFFDVNKNANSRGENYQISLPAGPNYVFRDNTGNVDKNATAAGRDGQFARYILRAGDPAIGII